MKTKQEIREEIRCRLQAQPEVERLAKSRLIEAQLFGHKDFQNAHCLLIYLSLPEEVETRGMIRKCLEERKTVVAPRMGADGQTLELRRIADLENDVEKGRFGLFEPRVNRTEEVKPGELDLIVVPGLAFDARGNRLGRGGGHYDRLLAQIPESVPRIALAFGFQIVDHLPCEAHDQPVGAVLSA